MARYRALISVERSTFVELEASSDQEAREAIFNNQLEVVGDSFFRNPRINELFVIDPCCDDDF
jgi:hypothetical protein